MSLQRFPTFPILTQKATNLQSSSKSTKQKDPASKFPTILKPFIQSPDTPANEFTFIPTPIIDLQKPIFIRDSIGLNGVSQNPAETQLKFKWLTISKGTITFNNVHIKAKIHVSGGAKLILKNCIVEPYDETSPISVEVFSQNSSLEANNTIFRFRSTIPHIENFSLSIRKNASAEINQCTFQSNSVNLSCIQGSNLYVKDTHFQSFAFRSIFISQSSAELENCEFTNNVANPSWKSIFSMSSNLHIFRSQFQRSGFGLYGIKSKIFITDTTFTDIDNICLFAKNQTQLSCQSCSFHDSPGNGVNFDNSKGYLYRNSFSSIQGSSIVIYGIESNPIILDNKITHSNTGIVARDISRPLILNNQISDIGQNAFSVSDFSQPMVKNCTISGTPLAFSISNGAKLIIRESNITANKNIDVFTEGIAYIDNEEIKNKSIERYGGKILNVASKHWSNAPHVLIIEKEPFPEKLSHVLDGKSLFEKLHTELVLKNTFIVPENLPEPLQCLKSLSIPKHKHTEPQICLKCGKNPATHVAMTCGHLVLCQECAENNPKNCPLCNLKIYITPKLFKSDECVVCLNKKADCICSCGHQCLCSHCAIKLNSDNPMCPLCQTRLASIKHAFL